MCREYFPWLNEGLQENRVELVNADGVDFMKTTGERFDVILVDSSEPIGPSSVLHGEDFFVDLKHRLNPGGLVVSQCGSPLYHLDFLKRQGQMLMNIYPFVKFYYGPVPTYPGGWWCYVLLSESQKEREMKKSPPRGLKYYTTAIHEAAFSLPAFMKDLS